MKAGMVIGAVLGAMASVSWGDLVYDDYDALPLEAGAPTGYYTFGAQIADVGVTDAFSVSPDQSLYVALDFSEAGWGGAVVRGVGSLDVTGGTLSVQLRSSYDFTWGGVVAFRLTDADGSVYRTANADFFQPSTTFTLFSQSVDELTQVDEAGTVPGLDLGNITEVGLLFYDIEETTDAVVFHVDDLTVIPEPSSLALIVTALTGFSLWRRFLAPEQHN